MLGLARLLLAPVAALCLAASLLPLATIVALGAPSLPALLREPVWLEAALRSLLLAEASVVIAWPVGVLAAIGLWTAPRWLRRLTIGASLLALLVPQGWVGAGLAAAAGRGAPRGAHLAGEILGHAAPCAAIVLLVLTSFLNRADPRLLRAAAASGASPVRAYALVLLPALAIPLALAAAAAFALSLGQGALDRGIALPGHPSLGGLLAMAGQAGDDTDAAPAALALLALALLPLLIVGLLKLLYRPPA